MSLLLLVLVSASHAFTINVVLPKNFACIQGLSPFMNGCDIKAPEIDVISAKEGLWKETESDSESDSDWEYAASETCTFACNLADDFAACQNSIATSGILNFFPVTKRCCFSNCSASQPASTRNVGNITVRKAFRLPSTNIALNTSRVCITQRTFQSTEEVVYQCVLPDSVNEADVLIHNNTRGFSLLLKNVSTDKWLYSDLNVYNEPYKFSFSQPQSGSACNNNDTILKDMQFSQHTCTATLSAAVFVGKATYFVRGFRLGTANDVSLASNLSIYVSNVSIVDRYYNDTGAQVIPNSLQYIPLISPFANLNNLTLVSPRSTSRIEISELRIVYFANVCPPITAPAYGSMVCSKSPPEAGSSVCNFACAAGFVMDGASSLTCRDVSDKPPFWDSAFPVCNPLTCPMISRPDNGYYSCSNGTFGERKYTSVCTFSCNPGFNLSHTRQFKCSESGVWNDTEPICSNINDCNSSSCKVGAECFDGIQKTYCGLTIKSGSLRVISGGSLQTNMISLDGVEGNASITFDLDLNDVLQADVQQVRYGSSRFPSVYECLNMTTDANGTVTCRTERGVGRNLSFVVMYTIKIPTGASGETRLSYTYVDHDRTMSYPLPQFIDKTLRLDADDSLYEGNPLIGRTTLGEVIEFSGNNFIPLSFPKLMVYYGPNYTCALDSNREITTTRMRCKTQSGGQGTHLVFRIVVMDEIVIYSTDSYSYPVPPKVTRVYGCIDSDIKTGGCPTNGTTIFVEGVGFSRDAKVTVIPPAVTPEIYNSTFLSFVLAAGTGVNLPLVVRASDQDSDGTSKWLSYARPTVTNLTGTGCLFVNNTGVSQCPKIGTTLTLTGENFGLSTTPVTVLIGSTICTNVSYLVEHTQLTCKLESGSRTLLAITLIQSGGDIGRSSLTVSYFQCQPGSFINENDGGKCYDCGPNYFTQIEGRTGCLACDAGKFNSGGVSSCSLCPVGKASEAGQNCSACTPGKYAPNEGQKSECIACPAGRFSNSSGASDCIKCVPGTYQKLPQARKCDQCEIGRAQRSAEENTCKPCERGFFANVTGMSDCLACEPGSYNTASNLDSCTLCETGRAVETMAAIACDPCEPGRFASKPYGAAVCLDCAAGLVQPLAEQVECEECESGTFSGPKQSVCQACQPGKFARSSNSSECKDCSSGSFMPNTGASACSLCGVGTFSALPGAFTCTNCTAGKYSASSNSTECSQCAPGRAQELPRSSSCTVCPMGRFFGFSEATSCLPCAPGTFADSSNFTACSACAAGRYSTAGQATCLRCPQGRASFAPSQGACTECPNGKYASIVGASVCADCAVGYVQELAGQTSCHACQNGSVALNASNCAVCPAGTYSDPSNLIVCRDCMPGSFSSQSGRSSCELCLPGTFLSVSGKTTCERCPPDTFALGSAATRCEPCALVVVGGRCVCRYSTYMAENGTCINCPKGAECVSAGLEARTLKAAAGYWRSPRSASNPVFYKCLTLTHCPQQSAYSFDPTERNDLNYSSIVCGAYRRGPICALCLDGYKSSTVVSACVNCENNTKGTVLSILIILGMIIALGIAYWFLLRADTQLLLSQLAVLAAHGDIKLSRATSTPLDNVRRIPASPKLSAANKDLDGFNDENEQRTVRKSKTSFDFDDDDYVIPCLHTNRRGGGKETGQVKIIIGFFQIIYNLTAVRNLSWPTGFKMVVSAFSFINLDFIPWNTVGCAVPFNFYVRITIVALSPFVIMILVFFAYFLPSFWKDTRDFSDHDLARVVRHQKRNQLKKMFLFALFLMYPFISREVLSFFLCENVDGVSYLVPDFNLECYDELWRSWLGPVIVMIVIYPIGCPLTVLVLLYQHAKRDLLDTDFVRIGYGFLYEAYQNPRWWFEFLDMVHKILLTSVLNFFPDNVQLPAALVIIGLYTMAILLCTPYIEDSDDIFHLLAQAEIFNIVMCAWVLQTYTLTPDSAEEVLLSILLCMLLFTLLIELIRRIIIKLRPQYHKARRVFRESRGSNAPGQNLTSNLATIESKIEQNAYKLSVDDSP